MLLQQTHKQFHIHIHLPVLRKLLNTLVFISKYKHCFQQQELISRLSYMQAMDVLHIDTKTYS